MKKAFAAIAAGLVGVVWAAAQAPAAPEPAADQRVAMAKVAWLVGDWEGSGWTMMGPAGRSEFRGRETVESRLDGLVLVIEGTHRATGGERSGEVIHHALAFLSWDPDDARYRFRSHLADGRAGDYVGHVEDGAFVWGMDTPRGKIRYTIRLDDKGHWSEIGEHSADGTSWRQFFAMDMVKVDGKI